MGLPARLDFAALERELRLEPRVPCPVTHHFSHGIYARQMLAAAGSLVLGKKHRGPCLNIMLSGKCVLIDADGSKRELTAPQCFESPAGQKLAYVIEDMVWVNVWATNETDVERLETLLFDYESPDEFADDMAEIGYTVDEVRFYSELTDDLWLDPVVTPCIEVLPSKIQGHGCFPFRAGFAQGDYVGPARIGGSRTSLGRFTNHSRTPNVEFRDDGDGGLSAYALRNIPLGEEITVDYRQARGVA